jgi:hypothetical protein
MSHVPLLEPGLDPALMEQEYLVIKVRDFTVNTFEPPVQVKLAVEQPGSGVTVMVIGKIAFPDQVTA